MRSIVAVLATALLVFTVAGCSASTSTESTTSSATTAVSDTAGTAAASEPAAVVDRSSNDDDLEPVAFPSFVSTKTPEAIQERLDEGRAMMIVFYDSAQNVTKDQQAEVEAVADDYRGLVDLITYDVGARDKSTAQAAVVYASELNVGSTPYVLVVDPNGFITFHWKGFLDRDTLKREVERVVR